MVFLSFCHRFHLHVERKILKIDTLGRGGALPGIFGNPQCQVSVRDLIPKSSGRHGGALVSASAPWAIASFNIDISDIMSDEVYIDD